MNEKELLKSIQKNLDHFVDEGMTYFNVVKDFQQEINKVFIVPPQMLVSGPLNIDYLKEFEDLCKSIRNNEFT